MTIIPIFLPSSEKRIVKRTQEDQILLKISEKKVEKIRKYLEEKYDREIKFDGRNFYKKDERGKFYLVLVLIGLVFLWKMLIKHMGSSFATFMVVLFSILVIIWYLIRDNEISWLEISKIKGKTYLLIRRFNDEGYRYVDEDEILDLVETLNLVRK